MSVTAKFIETKNSINKLEKLAKELPKALSALAGLNNLVQNGEMEQSDLDNLIKNYKQQAKELISEEVKKAKKESEIISKAAETEVNNKIKNLTPVIAGVPVILPPPPTYAISQIEALSEVPQIAKDLSNILKILNDTLS